MSKFNEYDYKGYNSKRQLLVVQNKDSVYMGEVDDKTKNPEGYGAFLHNDKTRYYSFHSNGMRNGRGKCIYKNGSLYSGMWKNNKCHGLAKYTNHPGFDYYGYWIDGNMDFTKAGVLVTPDDMI